MSESASRWGDIDYLAAIEERPNCVLRTIVKPERADIEEGVSASGIMHEP